jgi:hypothetical protein
MVGVLAGAATSSMNGFSEKLPAGPKQRYLLVTVYLWFLLIVSALQLFELLGQLSYLQARDDSLPIWMIPLMGVAALINPVCITALLCWKKWGFWGLVIQALLGLFIGLYRHESLVIIVLGCLWCVILYGALHAGDEKRAWPQLD